MATVIYVAACLLVPFIWGVLVYWVFQQIERIAARRQEGKPGATPLPARRERSRSMWDYEI
jgi:hypothetical protein